MTAPGIKEAVNNAQQGQVEPPRPLLRVLLPADPFPLEVFPPELATNLTLMIMGLIVLLVSAPVIVTTLYRLRPKRTRPDEEPAQVEA